MPSIVFPNRPGIDPRATPPIVSEPGGDLGPSGSGAPTGGGQQGGSLVLNGSGGTLTVTGTQGGGGPTFQATPHTTSRIVSSDIVTGDLYAIETVEPTYVRAGVRVETTNTAGTAIYGTHDLLIGGTIVSAGTGIDTTGAVAIFASATVTAEGAGVRAGTLHNSGTIEAGTVGVQADRLFNNGAITSDGVAVESLEIVNKGVIHSSGTVAITGVNRLVSDHIISGDIQGAVTANGLSGVHFTLNDGVVLGDVTLTDLYDLIELTSDATIGGSINFGNGRGELRLTDGRVTGPVIFGDGNNYVSLDDSIVDGGIYFGSGADTIRVSYDSLVLRPVYGGAGNDIYHLDRQVDIWERDGTSGGIDRVYATFDYTLNENLENLTLEGAARMGTGNAGHNMIEARVSGPGIILNGLGGDDLLRLLNTTGGTLLGGSGNDRLEGTDGIDRLRGGAGNDILVGAGGADVIDGGAGIDTIVLEPRGRLEVNLAAGTATGVSQLISIENVIGTMRAETITGSDVANYISGGGQADRIYGLGGNDTFGYVAARSVGYANAILDGGSGSDTLSINPIFYGLVGNVTVDLAAGFIRVTDTGGQFSTSTLISIENVVAGNGADTLIGSTGANRLDGGLGTNSLTGGAGSDLFVLAAGGLNTIQDFQDGIDRIDMRGAAGVASFADLVITGTAEGARISWAGGALYSIVKDFSFTGLTAADFLFGAAPVLPAVPPVAGPPPVPVAPSAPTAAGPGGATSSVVAPPETISANPLVITNADPDLQVPEDALLWGTAGNAVRVEATDATIRIDGTVAGATDAIWIDEDVESCTIVIGETGVVTTLSPQPVEYVENDQGSGAWFFQGAINGMMDRLVIDNAGYIQGSVGYEAFEERIDIPFELPIYYYEYRSTLDLTNSGRIDGDVFCNSLVLLDGGMINGDLYVRGTGGTVDLSEGSVSGQIHVLGEDLTFIVDRTRSFVGADENDTLVTAVNTTLSGFGKLVLTGDAYQGIGNAAANSITSGAGNNRIEGLAGDDLLVDAGGDNRIDGGEGNDRIEVGDGTDYLLGGAGADFFAVGGGIKTIIGGTGLDTVAFNRGDDLVIDLSTGTVSTGDTLTAVERLIGGTGDDVFTGNGLTNTLKGRGGQDDLSGLGGADLLSGGAGNDRLTGGAGADLFAFESGTRGFDDDTIVDFENGIDRIDFRLDFRVFDFEDLVITTDGTDTVITIEGDTIRLLNTASSTLDAGDFLFA